LKKYVVVGGAGFIGCNSVRRLLERGDAVVVVDNLCRKGTASNLEWLRGLGEFEFIKADIRDADAMESLFKQHGDADVVLHLAGQVAVTTSVLNPREDFEINALGSLNILEAVRKSGEKPLLIYSSTNKVYGALEEIAIEERETRYVCRDYPHGISENASLDFHSPYGCSKGVADQYFRDYARIYGMRTVVYRQSCIYGPRQFGTEDQGWLAWFIIAAVLGRPISVYGNGKQVRDVLHVDDLVDAYLLAAENKDNVTGSIYNVGGGPSHTVSIWLEFGPMLERLLGKRIPVSWCDWRPGDQPFYVSDIRKIAADLGWEPTRGVEEGAKGLFDWVTENTYLFKF